MAPSHSKYAIYSGYLMSIDKFKNFVATLKAGYAIERLDSLSYIYAYDSWKRCVPNADRARVPRLMLITFPGVYEDGFGSSVEKLFFPVRYVRYTGEEQLLRNDENKYLWKENEADKAKFEEFARYVASEGGSLDLTSVAGFGCLKEKHPDYDWFLF